MQTTATGLVADLAAGRTSSMAALEHFLSRVDKHNPALNAVVALDVAGARAQAEAADAAAARGLLLGPLHGLPMTVKDTFETAGLVTTAGAPELAGHLPDRDADAVARLRAAGAVVFGKTNAPLYAGDFQSYNDVYGTTGNPWDLARTPGGSSGGSAAALAAGLTPLELGSDVAGSIRSPAHFCGVCGHLPTWGAVPARGHIPGAPGTLAVPPLGSPGPMARCVADLELALDVLAGPDLAGVPGGALPSAAVRTDELRLAVWAEHPVLRTDPEIRAALDGLAGALAGLGVRVLRKLRPPRPLYEIHQTYARLLLAVLAPSFPERVFRQLRRIAHRASPGDHRPAVELGRAVTLSYREWQDLDEQRARITAGWASVFAEADAVLTPAAPLTAFAHETAGTPLNRELEVNGRKVPYLAQMAWATPASLSGLPATTVPLGRSAAGLPFGVQVIAPRWHDRRALAVARVVERLTGGFEAPPGY